IEETEKSIARLEGISIQELKRLAQVGTSVEENIQFWTSWQKGSRPYIQASQKLSPLSRFVINNEGKININGNIILSPRALNRLLLLEKANLIALLTASLEVIKAGDRAPGSLSPKQLAELQAAHQESSLKNNHTELIDINGEIQISQSILQSMHNTKQNASFLLEQTYQMDKGLGSLPPYLVNSRLLERVEPRLMKAIREQTLPYDLQRAFEVMLHQNILGTTQDAIAAQKLIIHQLNIIAAQIEFEADYLHLSSLLDYKLAEKVVWNAATALSGKEEYTKLLNKIHKSTPISPSVMRDLIQIGPLKDEGTILRIIQDNEFRKALVNNPSAVLVLKKMCFSLFPSRNNRHSDRPATKNYARKIRLRNFKS
ncbi:MAG: hypothetical protein HC880_03750, partial [Bacteroidia bacterium]|nr:hypothetical protein [Bacteroidia bacterium]